MAMLRARTVLPGQLHRVPSRYFGRCISTFAVDVDQGASPEVSQSDGIGYGSPPSYPLYQAPQYQLAPQPAPIPPPPQPASGGTPFWVWLLLGAALMWVWGKFQELRKNPAAALMGMMSRGAPGGAGGGGGQDMASMMEMMKQMQSQGGGGFPGAAPSASPFGGMPGTGASIPTTAQDVSPSDRDGSKFEQNKQSVPAAAAEPAAPNAQAQQSTSAGSGAASSFFADSSAAAASSAQQGAASAANPAAGSFFSDTGAAASQGGAASAQSSEGTEKLIENMLQMVVDNPELQKQMNNFLPANMRDEATWKWIASSPDLRKQIAKQMAPNFNADAMKNFTEPQAAGGIPNPGGADMDKAMADMRAQGVDPNNYMSEMMADPEIMELFMKPHVTEALMEIQKNPQAAVNYMSDPDVSKLMTKMMSIQSKVGVPMPTSGMVMPPIGGAPGGTPPMGGAGDAMPDMAAAAAAAGAPPPPTPAAQDPGKSGSSSEAVPQSASTKQT